MAIEFVLCRRKDDHSITHEIARKSLRRWPDWEPVPTSDDKPASSGSPVEGASASEPSEPAGESASTKDTKTSPSSKSRSRAATGK